ncbi:M28 family metallopeptidase [Pseudoroseomonas wenyumeiae]
MADLPSVTVCTISKADGEALAARLVKGDAPRVTLHAKVDTGWRPTPILVGELDAPGGDAGAPFILLSGHQDTWYHGVMDNGSANIGMLEVARLCATRRAEWRRGLRVCFWSGHSHGRYSSSAWYADRNWAELERRCAAHVNVDSLGGIDADVLSDAGCMAPLNALAADAISAVSGQVHAGRRKNRNSDESFPGIGIPRSSAASACSRPSRTASAMPWAGGGIRRRTCWTRWTRPIRSATPRSCCMPHGGCWPTRCCRWTLPPRLMRCWRNCKGWRPGWISCRWRRCSPPPPGCGTGWRGWRPARWRMPPPGAGC